MSSNPAIAAGMSVDVRPGSLPEYARPKAPGHVTQSDTGCLQFACQAVVRRVLSLDVQLFVIVCAGFV